MGAEKAKHLVTLALTLKISRDFNKLSYLAGSAYTMNAQVCGGGHMIDAYTQLKGVFVNILSSHIYPLHLVYMCAPVQACTCTTHAQGWTCMHNCTHMLFYSSVLFFLFSYLSLLLLYLFLSLSHSFSRNILFPYVFLPPCSLSLSFGFLRHFTSHQLCFRQNSISQFNASTMYQYHAWAQPQTWQVRLMLLHFSD